MTQPGVGGGLVRYYRRLPHWQLGGGTYFLTFRSARGVLPDAARQQVLANILFDHGRRYDLSIGLVMPDHAHVILRPIESAPGAWHGLPDILKGIKGVSSRRINQLLGTAGRVWQDETFDRIVRDESEYLQKWEYIWQNPVRAGLVGRPEDYPWFVFGHDAEAQSPK